MNKNGIGRDIPAEIDGIGELTPYISPFGVIPTTRRHGKKIKLHQPGQSKIVDSIEEAIKKTGLKNGDTISFHHHFREGDYILNLVVGKIADMGIKNITLFGSSLNAVHEPLIEHIKNGVITKIHTSGMRGTLGEAISRGIMDTPVTIRSHGGRARAIEAGEVQIDVAFLGIPCCDAYGNANGYTGPSACGTLGYAMTDAKYADNVVFITDNLVQAPNVPASINQTEVDYIVVTEAIGNPKGIVSGATRYTTDPKELQIAKYASTVIEHSGYFKDGFNIQAGTGGASLAVARFLKNKMIDQGIKAGAIIGGITGQFVEMLEEGLADKILGVQDFDLIAAQSVGKNDNHYEIDAAFYASPHNSSPAVNMLDIVILSALEIDTQFNVNVITGSDGVMRGASGGHCDAAAGAKLTIVVSPLVRGRIPTVVDSVATVITPGASIDILVTERGVAINPARTDLIDRVKKLGLPLFTIEELRDMAYGLTGKPDPIPYTDKIVGLIEYRDGTIIDVVRQVQ